MESRLGRNLLNVKANVVKKKVGNCGVLSWIFQDTPVIGRIMGLQTGEIIHLHSWHN